MTIRWRDRYSEEDEQSQSRSRKESFTLQQWHLNLAVVLILVAIVSLLVWLIPEVKFVATIIFAVLFAIVFFLFNLVVWILTQLLILFTPSVFGVFVSLGVGWLDEQVGGRDENLPKPVHWLIALVLGFGVFYLWMYAPGSIAAWPFWLNDWPWFDVIGPHENLQWGWGVWAFISWLAGYFISNSIKNS